MREEEGFLQAIQANPDDDLSRLVYADWLDERGDPRGEFLRLQLAIRALAPDHPHRVSGEHELSYLRAQAPADWLLAVEPEGAPAGKAPSPYATCKCFEAQYGDRRWSEVELHTDAQDTECDAWKRLLDLIEEAAADGREDLEPRLALGPDGLRQIRTLPPTVAKLKAVKRLWLYGSHLVRLPPEVGGMESLEQFDPYTSYLLHWFPYEITRCKKLRDSRVSTRALYGNFKYRPPFPRLRPRVVYANGRVEPEGLSLKRWPTEWARPCSVCERPFANRRLHRVWVSLVVATDVLPLLVNACSEECLRKLPTPAEGYVQRPHTGGLELEQPKARYPSR
jgi:uncharacterized protein (TIGR02996 family)